MCAGVGVSVGGCARVGGGIAEHVVVASRTIGQHDKGSGLQQ